jgi:hypothetical protein
VLESSEVMKAWMRLGRVGGCSEATVRLLLWDMVGGPVRLVKYCVQVASEKAALLRRAAELMGWRC